MELIIPIDPRSIQSFQNEFVTGAVGAAFVYGSPAPPGINRLVFHCSVHTDDIAASRQTQMLLRSPGGDVVCLPGTRDGIAVTMTQERNALLGCIWVPTGFYIQGFIVGGAITAGKVVHLGMYYIDILKI